MGATGISAIIICLVLSGCSRTKQQPTPQQQSAQAENQSDKVPEQLKAIEINIEKIFEAFEEPSAATQNNTSDQNGKTANKGNDQAAEGGKGSQQAQPSPSPSPQSNQPSQESRWNEVLSTVHSLHYQWNEYSPSAAGKGASRTLIDSFSNALNNLTNSVVSKNEMETLAASNSLYAYIPDFYQTYKTKVSPEIKRIRYYTRDAILSGTVSNWAQAESDIGNLKASWSVYKNTVPDSQRDNADKLEYSIYELEKVLKGKSQPLTDIKGRVVMANIGTIESAVEKQAGQ